jgi:DnaJ-domain-containing protein 1
MSKQNGSDHESKKDVVLRIAVEAGALEHCEDHDTYFDPMDDEALERAQERAKELVEAKDSTVAIFDGNEDELIELLEDVVADAEESCAGCDDEDDEDSEDE